MEHCFCLMRHKWRKASWSTTAYSTLRRSRHWSKNRLCNSISSTTSKISPSLLPFWSCQTPAPSSRTPFTSSTKHLPRLNTLQSTWTLRWKKCSLMRRLSTNWDSSSLPWPPTRSLRLKLLRFRRKCQSMPKRYSSNCVKLKLTNRVRCLLMMVFSTDGSHWPSTCQWPLAISRWPKKLSTKRCRLKKVVS